MGMRGMTRKQKLALAENMAAMDWPATWAEPALPPAPTGTTLHKEKRIAEE